MNKSCITSSRTLNLLSFRGTHCDWVLCAEGRRRSTRWRRDSCPIVLHVSELSGRRFRSQARDYRELSGRLARLSHSFSRDQRHSLASRLPYLGNETRSPYTPWPQRKINGNERLAYRLVALISTALPFEFVPGPARIISSFFSLFLTFHTFNSLLL